MQLRRTKFFLFAAFLVLNSAVSLAALFPLSWHPTLRPFEKLIAGKITDKNLVNRLDEKGRSPIFYYIKRNKLDRIQWLVDHGASLAVTDKKGYTPVSYAVRFVRPEILKYLYTKGAPFDFDDPLLSKHLPELSRRERSTLTAVLSVVYIMQKKNPWQNLADATDSKNPICSVCQTELADEDSAFHDECREDFLDYAAKNAAAELIRHPATQKELHPQDLFRLGMNFEQYFQFLRGSITRKMNGQRMWRFCHGLNCLNGALVANPDKGVHHACQVCGHEGCLNCGLPNPHASATCEQTAMLVGGIKRCPGCNTAYQKPAGCNVITCPSCFTCWTWNDCVIRPVDHKEHGHVTPFTYKGGDLDAIAQYADIDGYFAKRNAEKP